MTHTAAREQKRAHQYAHLLQNYEAKFWAALTEPTKGRGEPRDQPGPVRTRHPA